MQHGFQNDGTKMCHLHETKYHKEIIFLCKSDLVSIATVRKHLEALKYILEKQHPES